LAARTIRDKTRIVAAPWSDEASASGRQKRPPATASPPSSPRGGQGSGALLQPLGLLPEPAEEHQRRDDGADAMMREFERLITDKLADPS